MEIILPIFLNILLLVIKSINQSPAILLFFCCAVFTLPLNYTKTLTNILCQLKTKELLSYNISFDFKFLWTLIFHPSLSVSLLSFTLFSL